MLSTSNSMISIGCNTNSRWATKCGYISNKEPLVGPRRKLRPVRYGPYTITKAVGDNSFELSIPPFLVLHPLFNVDCLQPYFPPLMDTSGMAEQLTPIELKPDYMEQATIDRIMETQIKNTRQQKIQLC